MKKYILIVSAVILVYIIVIICIVFALKNRNKNDDFTSEAEIATESVTESSTEANIVATSSDSDAKFERITYSEDKNIVYVNGYSEEDYKSYVEGDYIDLLYYSYTINSNGLIGEDFDYDTFTSAVYWFCVNNQYILPEVVSIDSKEYNESYGCDVYYASFKSSDSVISFMATYSNHSFKVHDLTESDNF